MPDDAGSLAAVRNISRTKVEIKRTGRSAGFKDLEKTEKNPP
jgi:hypothetical protein